MEKALKLYLDHIIFEITFTYGNSKVKCINTLSNLEYFIKFSESF